METRLKKKTRLKELALLFLKLGTTAFGGPAAHIAMMEDETVTRRRWLTHDEFLDLLGATNLIPGPNSTEMAIHMGRIRAGWAGILVAGSCFIFPAALMVTAIAWAYVRFGSLPQMSGLLYGIKPAVMAIIIQALWNLRGPALKSKTLAVIGIAATIAAFLGINVLIILLGTGALVVLLNLLIARLKTIKTRGIISGAVPFGLAPLFWFFLKVGSVLFGSGYVLLAFLRADLVNRYGWLTEGHLIDAIAVGQLTPGPVFTTATFIGYILSGVKGALVSTVGIFLPAFIFVGLTGPLIKLLRKSPVSGYFLDGVNIGALALMLFISWQLGRAAIIDFPTAAIATASAVLLFAYRLNSTWLILGGAAIGLMIKFLFH